MADLQQTTREALLKVPAFLKRDIDGNKVKVVESDAKGAIAYHKSPVAAVDMNDPNTIHVYDRAQFEKSPSSYLAHELTHRLIHQSAPGQINFKPINRDDPYSYDEAAVGQPLHNFSEEQVARQMEAAQVAQDQPDAKYRQQVAQRYLPVAQQLMQLKPATIGTTQPDDPSAINTTANPPVAMWDSAPPPAPPPAAAPSNDGWEEVPTVPQGSTAPQSNEGWEEVAPTEDHPIINSLRRGVEDIGYPAVGGAIGGAIGALGGGVMAVPGAALGAVAGNELKNALRDISGQDSTHGVNRVVDDAEAGVLGAQEGMMPQLRSVTKRIAGEGTIRNLLPGHVTDALHSDIGNTVAKVADEAGVKIEPTANLRKVIPNLANAVQEKADAKMKEISDVFSDMNPTKNFTRDPFGTGRMTKGTASALDMVGDYDQIPKQIEKQQQKIANLIGPQNAEKRAAAIEELKGLQTNLKVANDMLDKQGLKGAREEADRLFAQADALKQIAKAHVDSTFGYPKATTNPVQFAGRLGKLHDAGTLSTAVGEEHAQDLLDQATRASRLYGRATAAQNFAKGTVKAVAKGAGFGAAVHAHDILSSIE